MIAHGSMSDLQEDAAKPGLIHLRTCLQENQITRADELSIPPHLKIYAIPLTSVT
jgi:hypothetical protein